MNNHIKDTENDPDDIIEKINKRNDIYLKMISQIKKDNKSDGLSIEEKLKKISKTEATENLIKE